MKNSLMASISGASLAATLNACGVAAVLADPKYPCGSPLTDFKQFVDEHGVNQGTPILLAPVISRLFSFSDPLSHKQAYFAQRTGWLFLPAKNMLPEDMADRLVSQLRSGSMVVLIPQTAQVLPLENIDTRAVGLSDFEKTLLALIIEWQRSPFSRPLAIKLALHDGKRTLPKWQSAIAWADVSRHFAMTSRKVRKLMPPKA